MVPCAGDRCYMLLLAVLAEWGGAISVHAGYLYSLCEQDKANGIYVGGV